MTEYNLKHISLIMIRHLTVSHVAVTQLKLPLLP